MTHVGGALPALVLGLEPIVIGLVGSLVCASTSAAAARASPSRSAWSGEAVIAGFVSAGAGERPLLPLAALAAVVTLFSAYSVSLRQMAALPSAAVVCVASLGGAVAVLPIVVDRGRPRRRRLRRSTPGPSPRWLFAAVAAAGLGSLAWAAVLSRVRAAVAALGLYLIPIGGALASHFVLDEPLYARHAVGARDRDRGDLLALRPARGARLGGRCAATASPRSAAR